jgi:hypothetical protein
MELTKAHYNVADVVLLSMPLKTPINIPAYMQSVLAGKQDGYSPDLFSKMQGIAISRDSSIRTFLLIQGYTETIDHTIQRDMLTPKGEKARELGGHEAYKAYETKQKNKELWLNFPKRFWWLLLIVGWVGGCLSDIGKEALKRKIWPESTQSQPSTQQNVDTLHSQDSGKAYQNNKPKYSTTK